MEIRNLKTFLRVAALRNFTAAAKETGYSQANVSAQIKQLEEELGAPLFNRIGRNITLTQNAERLLPYARQIVTAASCAENLLRQDENAAGTVRAGIVESLFDAAAEEMILRYHERFPGIQLELTVDSTAALKESLRKGILDIAFLIDDPLAENEWQILSALDTEAVAVANPDHPLLKKSDILLEDLESCELIMMENNAPYEIRLRSLLNRKSVGIHPFLILQRSDMAVKLLKRGDFLSVLPYYTVSQEIAEGRLAALEIPGAELPQTVQAVMHKNMVPEPRLIILAGIFEERMKQILSDPSKLYMIKDIERNG